MRKSRTLRLLAGLLCAGTAVAACGTSSTSSSGGTGFTPPKLEPLAQLGQPEGALNVLAWPGYAEDGSNDPNVNWVTPFEQQTGCQVNVKTFGTSDEAVNLMKTGQYDVVSASGDASLRLIASGDVEPVNTALVPNYADVYDFLKNKPWNSVNNVAYGVPHGWGANVLTWRTDKVRPAPTSWSVMFDPNSPYKGKVIAYDSPIYIADAALYLMKHNPDLGIKNPYALDDKQFAAAVDLLKQQRPLVSEYWSDYLKESQALKNGDSVVGTAWQVTVNLTEGEGAPLASAVPSEGATGWSDTWMVAAKSAHKTCAYKWLDYIVSPKANAQVAEYFGEAPANSKACAQMSDPKFCDSYHAGDAAYASQIWYWTTPITQCVDGRTDVRCKDYGEWTRAWTEIKGVTSVTLAASSFLHRNPKLRLGLLLSAPLLWLGLAYLGALAALFVTAFWTTDTFTGQVVTSWSLDNFGTLFTEGVYRTITLRTLGIAVLVTVVDAVVAFPMAFAMARFCSPRAQRLLVIAVMTPLWASYLVKAYSWRVMLSGNGLWGWAFGSTPGYGVTATVLTLSYLWLPYMILPIYAGLERLPDSLLDAAGDLGARPFRTFWSVILPLTFPAIVAGSIFTFSLSLGDYITVKIVGGASQMLGNVVYDNIGAANNLPFAATVALVPVVIMLGYLAVVRRTGALENL